MDGRRHVAAGVLAGSATAAIAFQGGWADTWSQAAVLGGLCAGSALFPDLDTASRPQRWAARALAVALGLLVLNAQWREAALIGLAALLPLVTHHRGWTHRWWAVPVVPLAVILLWQAIARGAGGWAWSDPADMADAAADALGGQGPAYAAMTSGYLLHLVLDRLSQRRR